MQTALVFQNENLRDCSFMIVKIKVIKVSCATLRFKSALTKCTLT